MIFCKMTLAYLLIQDREPEAVRRLEKRAKRYFDDAEQVRKIWTTIRGYLGRMRERLMCAKGEFVYIRMWGGVYAAQPFILVYYLALLMHEVSFENRTKKGARGRRWAQWFCSREK